MSNKKMQLIDMTHVTALKIHTDKHDKIIEGVMQEKLNNQNSDRQSKAGKGNKDKKRQSTEILDEIIKQEPKNFNELLTLLDKHESIYEVDHARKQFTYIKKDGGVSAPVSFDYIEKYLTNK